MTIEREVKLLGIRPEEFHRFFSDHNTEMQQQLSFQRVVFDTIPVDKTAWIRLRTDGSETTLCYKKTHSAAIDGTEEIELVVGDFTAMRAILTHAGHTPRNYQENKREVFSWMNCQVTIDYWPLIDPYVEVEADDETLITACLESFAGMYRESTTDSTEDIYTRYGIDLRSIDDLRFADE